MFFNVDFNVMFQELHISKKVATHTQPKQQIYFTEAGIYIAILIICNNMIYIINPSATRQHSHADFTFTFLNS